MGGCCGCTPKCCGMKMLVAGLVLLAGLKYFNWNPWTVVSWLLVVKGLMLMLWKCPCQQGACCEMEAKPMAGKKKK